MRTCEDMSRVTRQVTKWTFGDLFNRYFGDLPVTMLGEAEDGSDLVLSVTREWLSKQHVNDLGISPEDAQACLLHTNQCDQLCCVEARNRTRAVLPILHRRELPDGEALLLLMHMSGNTACMVFERGNGCDVLIDLLKQVASWYTEEEFATTKA